MHDDPRGVRLLQERRRGVVQQPEELHVGADGGGAVGGVEDDEGLDAVGLDQLRLEEGQGRDVAVEDELLVVAGQGVVGGRL